MTATLWTVSRRCEVQFAGRFDHVGDACRELRRRTEVRGAVVDAGGAIHEERGLTAEWERTVIREAAGRWMRDAARACPPTEPPPEEAVGAATEPPPEAPLPVSWDAPVVEAPAVDLSVTADLERPLREELTRLQALLADETAPRVAAEAERDDERRARVHLEGALGRDLAAVGAERDALAASLRERSAQLDAARRDLEVSRALRGTQADTIRRLSAELDTARPDRPRRERQNTRRRVERVCAAMAKHLAGRAR